MTKTISFINKIVNRIANAPGGLILVQQATIRILQAELVSSANRFARLRDQATLELGAYKKEIVKLRSDASKMRQSVKDLTDANVDMRKQHDETYQLLATSSDPIEATLPQLARFRLRDLALTRMKLDAHAPIDAPPDSELPTGRDLISTDEVPC